MVSHLNSRLADAETRLLELGITLPASPQPFGIYVAAAQSGRLLFFTGMLPTEGRAAEFIGRIGADLAVPDRGFLGPSRGA
jgi:hypothetical protein